MPKAPRKIEGTPGSRILVELTRAGWVLVLNYDDGDLEFQNTMSRGHDELETLFSNIRRLERHVTVLGVGGENKWYIDSDEDDQSIISSESWCSSSCDRDFKNKQQRYPVSTVAFTNQSWIYIDIHQNIMHSQGASFDVLHKLRRLDNERRMIHDLCLSQCSSNGYFIRHSAGFSHNNLSAGLRRELNKRTADGEYLTPLRVCEAADGSWLVLREYDFACSGIPGDLVQKLTDFYNLQGKWIRHRNEEIGMLCADQPIEAITESEKYKKFAIHCATLRGWMLLSINEKNRVVSFRRVVNNEFERINCWYTTKTVSTRVRHPRRGPCQMYRRCVTTDELDQIFRDPRAHVGKGYFKREPTVRIPTPLSTVEINEDSSCEFDSLISLLVGSHKTDQFELDTQFAFLVYQSVLKKRGEQYPELDFSKGDILVRSFVTQCTLDANKLGLSNKVSEAPESCISGFPIIKSLDAHIVEAGLKKDDVMLSIRISCANRNWSDIANIWTHVRHLDNRIKLSGRGPEQWIPEKYLSDVSHLPHRVSILRNGIRHDIIAICDENGSIGCEPIDGGARPLRLTPVSPSPLAAAGLRHGDQLVDFTIPLLSPGSNLLAQMFRSEMLCTIVVFRKA